MTLTYSYYSIYAIVIVTITMTFSKECDETSLSYATNQTTRLSSRKHGTYMIQSLMSVTEGYPCDKVTIGGLIRIQAVKYAIETRTHALGLNIGYQIDDACLSLPVTMKRALEIVKDHENYQCLSSVSSNSCPVIGNKAASSKKEAMLAVIGAYFSFTTIPLSSLLSVFSIPQLSYGASSPILSKRTDFKSTFRSIPPDTKAIQVMIEVIKHFGWSYVFVIGSDDEYGKMGLRLLKKHASENNICITGEMFIPFVSAKTRGVAKDIAAQMKIENKATVVVMFNYALQMAEYILQEAEELNLHRVYLTSEAWNPEVLTTNDIPKNQLESVLTVSLDYGETDKKFIDHVNRTIYEDFYCDIWLRQFILTKYNCLVRSIQGSSLHGIDSDRTNCTVSTEDILLNVINGSPNQINNLIDLVDSVVYALERVVNTHCSHLKNMTECRQKILPAQVTEALQHMNFTTRQNRIFTYDSNGDPYFISYSLEQIQYDAVLGRHMYVPFGKWKSKDSPQLDIYKNSIRIPKWSLDGKFPISSCSVDCLPGFHVVARQGCCWKCQKCDKGSISNSTNAKSCSECQQGFHTKNLIECLETPIFHVEISDAIGMSTTIASIIGLILSSVCLMFLKKFKDTQAVKGLSKRFLVSSFTLIILTFCYTILHLIPLSTTVCQVRNIYYHMMLTMFSLVLLIKNKSVARFISKYVNNKTNSKIAEIILSVSVISTEVCLLVVWQLNELLPLRKVYGNYEYFEECEIKFSWLRFSSFALPFVIILIASVQSLSDRHAKVQYGENKFLHYTCLAFSIINLVHVVTLNQVTGKYKELVILITTISFGYIYMGLMLTTKIFHAFIEPKRKLSQAHGVCNIGFPSERPISQTNPMLNQNANSGNLKLATITKNF